MKEVKEKAMTRAEADELIGTKFDGKKVIGAGPAPRRGGIYLYLTSPNERAEYRRVG